MEREKQPQIQVLRAIAVLLVVVYHVRPNWVPGGFVGVDVFFVISGFLITGSLIREGDANGRVRLRAFWARRVRRLMPAATVVLAAVLVGMTLLLPVWRWPDVIQQVVASALSVENWVLALQSVDYLSAGSTPTPVQHFWSLGVEEQFYVIWPLLIVGGILVARRLGTSSLRAWRLAVAVLFGVFLTWSIVETALSPATAYFSTATRAWELLLGAALAVWRPRSSLTTTTTSVAALSGLGLIALSVFVISPSTPFPGAIALLPTVGAALVILSGLGQPTWRWVAAPLRFRPAVYVGDISYSLYLWHWPVIVFAGTRFLPGQGLSLGWAALAVVLSVVLAALSTRFVERPFQHPTSRLAPLSLRRTAVLGAALLTITAVLVGASVLNFGRAAEQAAANADPRNFPGARLLDPAFDASQWNDVVVPPIPDPAGLYVIERQLTTACMTLLHETKITTCEAGDLDADRTVVLVGDSHAAQWLPALDQLGIENGWHVILAGRQYCTWSAGRRPSLDRPVEFEDCEQWNAAIEDFILDLHPDLVVHGALAYGYPDWIEDGHNHYDAEMADGYADAWKPVLDAGIPVVALHEVPRYPVSAVPCLTAFGAAPEDCSYPLTDIVTGPSWMAMAAELEPRVLLVDPVDGICPDGRCQSVIGNIYTYRDDSHISDPYARSLSWLIGDAIRTAYPDLFRLP